MGELRHATSLPSTIPGRMGLSRGIPYRGIQSEYVARLKTLFDRNVMARCVAEINLPGPRDFLFRIEEHLFPLRNPARSAGNCKQHRKHGHWETHGLVDQPGVEVHVGIELALDEVVVFEGNALALESDFQERILAHQVENLIGDMLDDASA